MARAALQWSLDDLVRVSGVSRQTIHRFESGGDAYQSTITKLEKALIDTNRIEFTGNCVCLIKT